MQRFINTNSWYEGYCNGQRNFGVNNKKSSLNRLHNMGILGIPKDYRILDFGCGDANLVIQLKQLGFQHVTGIEPDIFFLKLLKEKYISNNIVIGEGPGLPFNKNSFDVIISMSVLHHIPNTDLLTEIVKEFADVLRPNGLFVYTEPANTLLRRFLTPVLLSPLSRLFKFANQKRLMVEEEHDTLNKWFQIEQNFPAQFLTPSGFSIKSVKKDFLKRYVCSVNSK